MSDSSFINDAAGSLREDEAFLATHPWVRHYEPGVAATLSVPGHPLTWLLDQTASRHPERAAFSYYGAKISYSEFSRYTQRFALELQRAGVKKGDRVAIALPNIPQYPIAFYGALRAGAVVVPTNPLYTEHELQYQLADSDARVLIVLDQLYPVVRGIRQQTALEQIYVTSAADFLPTLLHLLYPFSVRHEGASKEPLTEKEMHEDPTMHAMHPILESHSQDEIALDVPILADDLAVLQYTGGTTGLSKGAMLTHRNLLANTLQIGLWFPHLHEAEEVMLCAAPFFHAYGMTAGMNVSILLAATMSLLPRFRPKDVVKVIRHDRPTLFPGIPTMYIAIMRQANKHPDDLKSIRYCISGAAPLPAKVQSDFETITYGKLVEGYGLSEAAPVTHCNPLTVECRNGSIGLPLPGIDAAIVRQGTDEPLPMGELGEIVMRGPNIMQGYWKREEETRAALHQGWLHTGDLGTMDKDGYFYVVERAKDVIINGGFNVYPREVEEVLFQHPLVAEAAVAGTPDAYRGEAVAAYVVLKSGVAPSEEVRQSLIQFCRQNLATYKVPRVLEFRQSLPRSLIGKVIRRQLHVEGTGQ